MAPLINHLLGMRDDEWRDLAQTSPHVPSRPRGPRSDDARRLSDRIDRLQLVCMALWELIEEKTSLTSEELAAKVKELDLADGKADGKVSRTVKNCTKCGRAMSPRHQRCLYCGSAKLHENPFESA
jgi:ribosomal protein S27AE